MTKDQLDRLERWAVCDCGAPDGCTGCVRGMVAKLLARHDRLAHSVLRLSKHLGDPCPGCGEVTK